MTTMKSLTKRITLYVIVGAIVGLAVVELPHAKRYTQHGLVERVDVPTMTKDADLAVIGVVKKRLGTTRQTDATGEDMVYTRWLIQPDRTIKGRASASVIVRTMGGRYGLTVVDVEDQPTFEVGEKVMLFLQSYPGWSSDYRVVGEFQGKFTLNGSGTGAKAVQAETDKQYSLGELEQAVTSAQ